MGLQRHQQEETGGGRYDEGTLRKVTELAQRLQDRHQETLTAREMEEIGGEVGLKPAYIRRALAQLTEQRSAGVAHRPPVSRKTLEGRAAAWWAAGWTIPFMLMFLLRTFIDSPAIVLGFFMGWAIYIGGGIMLSSAADAVPKPSDEPLSRGTLLELLFALQRELEGQKQHRAFLSVDVVGSSEMKHGASDLAVEYSFRQFQQWAGELVRAEGGQIHGMAGDGIMAMFPTDAGAIRAARGLQERLPQFNRELNHLAQPFVIRCGVSAGEVALDERGSLGELQSRVIDRAAALQKRSEPGGVLISGELAAAALTERSELTPLPDPVAGAPVFSLRPRALPGEASGDRSAA
jgi:class 3 adenylate cyclase